MGLFFLTTTYCVGQNTDLVLKKVKGVKSKILDNRVVGIMDTVLFQIR